MQNITKLLEQSEAGFKRYTGTHRAIFEKMLKAMQARKVSKIKLGLPSDLSAEAQILLALTYCLEYRTLYHIGMDFGVHKSSASHIVKKVKDVLIY